MTIRKDTGIQILTFQQLFFAINASCNANTGVLPLKVIFGQRPKFPLLPVDVKADMITFPSDIQEYLQSLTGKLENTCKQVKVCFLVPFLTIICIGPIVTGLFLPPVGKEYNSNETRKGIRDSHLANESRKQEEFDNRLDMDDSVLYLSTSTPIKQHKPWILFGMKQTSVPEIKANTDANFEKLTTTTPVNQAKNEAQKTNEPTSLTSKLAVQSLAKTGIPVEKSQNELSPANDENGTVINDWISREDMGKDSKSFNVNLDSLSWNKSHSAESFNVSDFRSSRLKVYIEIPSLWVPPQNESKRFIEGFMPIIVVFSLLLVSSFGFLPILYTRQLHLREE